MGFKFSFLCDLLSSLEDNRIAKVTATDKDTRLIGQWFSRHERHIYHPETDRLALLSCMFPERRPDRVYWLQATSLARVIGRCLGLGSSRLSDMDQWREPGGPDLGQCVENVMRQAENRICADRAVSVEEIDQALDMIASRCRFSGPRVRRQQTAVDVESSLATLYRRLSSRDAKWLTRMILKSYSPVALPEKYTLGRFHFLLPHLLQFQNTFEGALDMLSSEPMDKFPPRPDPKLAASLCSIAVDCLRPRPGIKIGRPEYFKARSIKHCHQMAKGRRMSIERKYDGEYCQIHVDLTNKQAPIQIFSKSGKDSTADRSVVVPVLKDSLRIGMEGCKFTKHCILEGELLVWSDKLGGIADFHKLRKFLPRAGTFIGIDHDSPPQPYEHLMVVFFDILLLDDDVCLRAPHRQRRLLLQEVVRKISGCADIAEQEILDFDRAESQYRLEASFAKAIAHRWEGYVLKASDEPYFPIYAAGVSNSFGRWIKLKKDYIPGLGDTVDLVLVGAGYNAQDGAALTSLKHLRWTHFLVGCLLNKDAVLNCEARPHYRVVDVVNRHCMHWKLLELLNQLGEFHSSSPEGFEGFEVEYGRAGLPAAAVIFKKPFVVEMMGSGFEKPSGARYFTLRFPRILKVHIERSSEDAASFRELQLLAEDARSVPVDELSQEEEQWRKRLKVGNGLKEYIVRRSRSLSTESRSSTGSDIPGGSDTTMGNHEDGLQLLPAQKWVENPSSKTNPHQTLDSIEGTPAVYVDESRQSPRASDKSCDGQVLVETQNSSNHRRFRHKDPRIDDQNNDHALKAAVQTSQDNPSPAVASGARGTSQNSVYRDETRANDKPVNPTQTKTLPSLEKPYEQIDTPISPLTTIPVYMSGSPSEGDISSDPQDSSSLSQFLQALGSDETKSLFKRSNPQAASQDAVFGIALVNPGELPLGQLIHKIAEGLSRALRVQKSTLPSSGRIFFLDAVILRENIKPEDPEFCLRQTWRALGMKHYYACLRWKYTKSRDHEGAGLEIRPAHQSGNRRGVSDRPSPSLLVSFDNGEILALGEYTSLDGLTDPTTL
ncbi:uncharacterized protein N7496_004378 [Penicillium cataractarum]|uniref:ATP-dependent DNA ligase family profile domain-containing protein n=1 Tax=Penicillium cataractarum TaxID=2100454 RepID=A0A9W9SP20_9EURO|nr:uncharacterized protein N7496_004378 [Penicillium cataractarum]KAJ5381950.1 hypothetical protein N7496_004378 [Penicillium cataractarum]